MTVAQPSGRHAFPPLPLDFRGTFRADVGARHVYSESAGVARIIPRAVAVPTNADDVVVLVRWAAANGVPLIPRGSASSMANGAVGDGVIVDLGLLTTLGVPHAATSTLTCGAGVLRDRADAAARTIGMCFPVDPSSGAFCTVGGMCATNAAGARSVRFGATRVWVNGLDCVFADGSRGWIRRGAALPTELAPVARFLREVAPLVAPARDSLSHAGVRKESSGYALAAWLESGDLVDVLIGSEGTVALIVNVELLLAPVPVATASVLATFASLEDATRAAAACSTHGATAVELLDRTFLDIVRSSSAFPIPENTEGALMVEAEGISAAIAVDHMRRLAALCTTAGATKVFEAPDDADETALWQIRHAASPILNRLHPALASMQLVEDGAVPPDRFPEYVRGVREIFAHRDIRCAIFGHAGDAHAHVNALVDVHADGWRPRVEAVLVEVTALIARLGGTLTAEHGDGRLRTPLLAQVWSGSALRVFAATKLAFDPLGILNPGVKIPTDGQNALTDIKYDPALPPLDSAAREALDSIVRSRSWAQHRLALL